MKSEKRMVGDYTVLCAVNIGSREIILAENEQDKNGERFLCCYGERNDIFQRYSECAVGDDYIDAALFFAERIKRDAELFRSEVEKLDIPVISTGSLTLDRALGIGGLPRGRVVEIYGPESSGKTTLALHTVAQLQKTGGTCTFIDAGG